MKPTIIGLSGKAKSGKSTVAGRLMTTHGFCELAFVDTLKDVAAQVFGFSFQQTHGGLKEVEDPFWGVTPRRVMQVIGTEICRSLHPDVWVRALMRQVQARASTGSLSIAISDVRFPNEVEAIKSMGGQVWRVKRGAPRVGWFERSRVGRKIFGHHESEVALDHLEDDAFDQVIDNQAMTIEELYGRVDAIMLEDWRTEMGG